jgi:hypothetical protein
LEAQGLWSLVAVGLLPAIVVLSCYGAWATLRQAREINYANPGRGVSLVETVYNTVLFFIIYQHGKAQQDWALIFNGIIRGFAYAALVLPLIRFKKPGPSLSKLVGFAGLINIAMLCIAAPVALPHVLFWMAVVGLVVSLLHPWNIIRIGHRGDVIPGRHFATCANSVCLIAYSWIMRDRVVVWVRTIMLVSTVLTLVVYYAHPSNPRHVRN